MRLRLLLSAAKRKMLCSLYRRTIPLGNHGPIVSFGFDDFPRSSYLVGGSILEAFGARGTYYTAVGLMHTETELGELCNFGDLQALLAKGHELGTQTFQHSSCCKVSLDTFRGDVQKGIRELEVLTGYQSNSFAYPYGHVTIGAKKTLGPALASSRSIFPGINGPEIDLNLLLANRVYGDVENMQPIQDLIAQNVEQKGWLIFYTHDVRPNPSEYGCTPALFEFAVSAAKSGSRILTVEQVLAELKAAPQSVSVARPATEMAVRP